MASAGQWNSKPSSHDGLLRIPRFKISQTEVALARGMLPVFSLLCLQFPHRDKSFLPCIPDHRLRLTPVHLASVNVFRPQANGEGQLK